MKVTTSLVKPRGAVGAFPRDHDLLRAVIAAARAADPAVCGLTHVTRTHAVLQVQQGQPTYYLVELEPDQARALGFPN